MKFNLKDLKEDLISDIAVRLEKEYLYYEVLENGETQNIGGTCFITPPRKGEFYLIHRKNEVIDTYEVVNVAHSHSSLQPSYLYLKKVSKVQI